MMRFYRLFHKCEVSRLSITSRLATARPSTILMRPHRVNLLKQPVLLSAVIRPYDKKVDKLLPSWHAIFLVATTYA